MSTKLRFAKIKKELTSLVNNIIRQFLNDKDYDREVAQSWCDDINAEITKRPYISGITLSGGDCMYSPVETLKLIKKLNIPHNNIWCYTGFTFEQLIKNNNQLQLLKHINVLVDGRFEYSKRDITLAFKGSSNQRIIDVKQSLKQGEIILYEHSSKV